MACLVVAYADGPDPHAHEAVFLNCSADADLTAAGNNSNVGGLIGCLGYYTPGTVTNSHSTGDVTATGSNSSAGGLAGEIVGSVSKSYATGSVTVGDNSSAGGLVGVSWAVVHDSYAMGNVSSGDAHANSNSYAGGFAGQNWSMME